MTQFAPDARVMVSPRYMAGAGDRVADVIGPLIHLFGWKYEHDPAAGHVTIDSPDGTLFVDFTPLHPLGQQVTVAHHEPHWEMTFSRQSPLEAVAAVTQALPQLHGDRRHAERIPITDMSLDQLARLNGWSAEDGTLTSPDLYCRLEHAPDQRVAWRVEHLYFENAPLATFTQDTPKELVGNYFSHLASSLAVERTFADVPLSTRFEHSSLITPVHNAAINPHIQHALAQLSHPGRHR
ncbi:DUF317 domain-containing protein [Streptomyces sp. NPDC087440]|uniref:DUF317 domain-containing protein n=1 Tax=Streptomyces sp. NPDC087440 TaxID=3365790 RepID=UPI0037F6411C